MIGLYVSVPIACWRKGQAREYLETHPLPPPSTCYGFLLSLVGEEDRRRHLGARVTAGLLNQPERGTVLRTLWRVKKKADPPGVGTNLRPDFQELLTGAELVIWCDSADEEGEGPALEARVRAALASPGTIDRYGGLSLGESTHLVNDVRLIDAPPGEAMTFLLAEGGLVTLPVWVDHVGSSGTAYVTGQLEPAGVPPAARVPEILPIR